MEIKTKFDLHKTVYFFKEKQQDNGGLYIAEGIVVHIDIKIRDNGEVGIMYVLNCDGRKQSIREENMFDSERTSMIEFKKNLNLFLGDPNKYVRPVEPDYDDDLPF